VALVCMRVPYKLRAVRYNAPVTLLTNTFPVRCLPTHAPILTQAVCYSL